MRTRFMLVISALAVVAGTVIPAGTASAAPVGGGSYYGLTPARVLDTRRADQGPCLAAGTPRFVTVAGRGGVPDDAASVVLNVTVTSPSIAGHLSVFPAGEDRPTASSLNFAARQSVANYVTAKVGVAGQVAIFISAGCAHVIVDVAGFHTSGSTIAGGYRAITPTRRLDTRSSGQTPCISGGSTRPVTVAGVGGVPSNAATVMLNVTVVAPQAPGFLTVYPAGETRPLASNLNYATGRVIANAASVKVGSAGEVVVYVSSGCVNVLVDVVGFTTAGTPNGGGYVGLSSSRLLDTRRTGQGPCVSPFGVRRLTVVGGSVPNTAASVTLNVTVVRPSSGGYLTAFPSGANRPTASNLNFDARRSLANLVTATVGSNGQIGLFVSAGCAHVVVDLDGYTTAPPLLPVVSSFAGFGTVRDGLGGAARFGSLLSPSAPLDDPFLYAPRGVTVDAAGNSYVADTSNNVIRKVTPGGMVTTLAGSLSQSGSANGIGASARFLRPSGVAVDRAGVVYVADTFNNTIRKITPAGIVSTLAGSAGQSGDLDGTGAAARFARPTGLAVDSAGNVYVADTANSTIRKITRFGVVTTLAGRAGIPGSVDGISGDARLNLPEGIAVNSVGMVFVADTGNSTIREISALGDVTTLAGTPGGPVANGVGPAAGFLNPTGIAITPFGNLVVADTGTSSIRKVTPVGVVTTFAGAAGSAGFVNAKGSLARFNHPRGIAVTATGTSVVVDSTNRMLRKINSAGSVSTLAGTSSTSGFGNGNALAARFSGPADVAVDSLGFVYVADKENHLIRKITPAGEVTRLAGGPGQPGSADGSGTLARFNAPESIAVDAARNLFVADTGNHTIRKITPTGVVSTFAGSAGAAGSADGSGSAARFNSPSGIAVNSTGSVYVADSGNQTIRRLTSTGVVVTVAGSAGVAGSADGTSGAARFNNPAGIVVDRSGTLFVCDRGNSSIRKIALSGDVTTLAGGSNFSLPTGIDVDALGNVFVADLDGGTVQKVTPLGVVSAIAGSGQFEARDGTGGIAGFGAPSGIAITAVGDIFVAESGFNTIRKIAMLG